MVYRIEPEALLGMSAVLNPVFSGSVDVGGADADLILDDVLIEVKATTDPKRISPHWPVWLYQLIGYALLDYDDEFEIRELGVFLARQTLFIKWSIAELLCKLAGDAVDLRRLREEVREVLAQ